MTGTPLATVTVDVHRGTQVWDRMLLGQFLEHFHRQVYGGVFAPGSPLSDGSGFRLDVVQALRDLRVPVVRWPGGCFVSAYHWVDGIGADRPATYDKAWRVEDPNTFGTDEFVAWCRLIGAEPYICTNGGTGTAEEMSDWVEYCNQSLGKWAARRRANGHAAPHAVRHWSIGNENYGFWEIGAKTAGEWGRFVRESAKMMKRVDPSIRLLAAATNDVEWMSALLREAGDLLDLVSVHGYYDAAYARAPADYASCMLRSVEPERDIVKTEHLLAALGRPHLGIAFDEWNLRAWHHPHAGDCTPIGHAPETLRARDENDRHASYTMADAVFSACFLNACLRHARSVRMANMAPVVNVRGPLFVHPDGIVKRTTYHVLWMYARLLGDRVADAWVESPPFTHGSAAVPLVDAVATCDERMESWRIVLVNRHADEPARCRLRIGGATPSGRLHATTLSGDDADAYNDVSNPARVSPRAGDIDVADGVVRLPPHSATVVEWDRRGG